LKGGDYVACPSKLPTINKIQHIDLFSLPDDVKVFIYSKKLIPLLYKKAAECFGTLKKAHKTLQIKESYCIFTGSWRRENKVPLYVLKNFIELLNYPKEKALSEIDGLRAGCIGTTTKRLRFTTKFNKEWAEFLGLVLSDGNIDREHVSFYVDARNRELIEYYNSLCNKLFGILPNVTKSRGVYRLGISNIALAQILHYVFGIPSKQKARTFKLPQIISSSKPEIISHFIKAYVECDGYISKEKREIEISTASEPFMRQLQLLLLKLNMSSSITTKTLKGHTYHRVRVCGGPALNLFKKNVGTITSKRANILNTVLKGTFFFEKRNLIPIDGKYLQLIRTKANKPRSEVAKQLSKTRSTHLRNERNQVGVYKAFLKELVATYRGYSFDGGADLDNLEKLASSDLSWIKVREVKLEKPKSEWA
jgi:intein/homing endonuclease